MSAPTYVNSNNIIVFPAANRRDNSRAVYTSEVNLINMINCLTDADSFLIRAERDTNNNLLFKNIEVIIHGYYFQITNFDFSVNTLDNGDIYFGINVSDTVSRDFPALSHNKGNSLDDGGEFTGLAIVTVNQNSPLLGYNYYLKFGEKTNNDIIINNDAYFKFDVRSLFCSLNINGSTVNYGYPRITSEKYKESGNDTPSGAKKGDIFIVYN